MTSTRTNLAKVAQRLRMAIVPLALLMLPGCVNSATPVLTDAKPLFGLQGRFQLYSLRDGAAHEPHIATFRWDGARYVLTGSTSTDTQTFSTHEFEGRDILVQNFPKNDGGNYEYALARKLADGVYLFFLVEEDASDEATRTRLCAPLTSSSCRIATREALLTFARATAGKPNDTGGLAIIVADDKK